MAGVENSTAMSDNTSSGSHSTSVLNSKKPNVKTSNPTKPSSPAKSSSTKTSQPVKLITPKSSPKMPTSNVSSIVQKSGPVKSSSIVNKRMATALDLKSTSEQKQTSLETSVVKKAGRITQPSIADNILKSKTSSIEKLSEVSSTNKALQNNTKLKTHSVEKLVEASALRNNTIKSKTHSVEKLSDISGVSKSSLTINDSSSKIKDVKEIIITSPDSSTDLEPVIVDLKNTSLNLEERNLEVTCKGDDNDSASVYKEEIVSKVCAPGSCEVKNLSTNEPKYIIQTPVETECSKENVKSEVCEKSKSKTAVEVEEELVEEGYIIINPEEEKYNIEGTNLTCTKPSSESRKQSQSMCNSLVTNESPCIKSEFGSKKIKDSNQETFIEKSGISGKDLSDSKTISDFKTAKFSDLDENKTVQSTPKSVIIDLNSNHDVVLSPNLVAKVNNACSLSGDSINAFNSISSEASSKPVAFNSACNFASESGNFNTNNSIEIVSNHSPPIKDVSDPISPKAQVTKPCETSKPDGLKINGSRIISEPSCRSTDNPINNSQVSSQDIINNKDETVPGTIAPPPEETKHSIRLKVWDLLEKNNHVLFPRPCKGRIPHFVGSPEAADKLATLDEFKKAKNIKVNPDKPQAHVRFLTLEAGKNLLVPIPRLRTGLFRRIAPPAGATKEELKTVVTQQGFLSSGENVGFDDKVSVDLVVLGAVAVSKEGYRIGKGEGYADLEFAIMMKMGAITQDTVVITTVHDEQVFDTLPHHLFKEHDVPVDFIITPTKIYEIKPRLPKPSGIIWNILSYRRLQQMPILKTLLDKEIAEGNDCHLKEVDSDPEEQTVRPFKYFRRVPWSRHRDHQMKNRNQRPLRERSAPPVGSNNRPPQKKRQSRTFRRKPAAPRSSSLKEQLPKNAESRNVNRRKDLNVVERARAGGDGVGPINRKFFHKPKPRNLIAFSIRVSGISQGTRVRDLKTALKERGVRPYDITWQSQRGRALLHFSQDEMFKDKEPQLLSEMSSIDVVEGFPAKLEFQLPGNAKAYKYDWFLNGKPVTAGHCKLMCRLDGSAALSIDNVNLEDAGEYTVTIRNKLGEISTKGNLNVTAKIKADAPEIKPSFLEESEEISVQRNTPLLISLSIAGNPVPDVEWSKDGVVLSPSGRIQFLCDGNKVGLKINQCKMIDAGEYKCKLQNPLGEAEISVKATIVTPSRANHRLDVSKVASLQDISNAMDDIIAALRDLKVKGEGEEDPKGSLSVEPANTISRIESTGISAV